MKHDELNELMHAVLDGEATPAQEKALQSQLAADPAARSEFDALQKLFGALGSIPAEHPPEGLVAAVGAAVATRARVTDQLSVSSRVFVHMPSDADDRRVAAAVPDSSARRTGTTPRSAFMTSQNNKSFGNRKVWFGAGVAAIALLVVGQTHYNVPFGEDVMGTIVPAQRYRAAPNGSEDVKLAPAGGSVAGAQGQTAAPIAEAERVTADRVAAGRLAAAGMVADKASVEKMSAERVQAERMLAEKVLAEKVLAEKVQAERLLAEKMSPEKMQAEKALAERLLAEKVLAEKVLAEKVLAEKVLAERVLADKVLAEKVLAEKVLAERMLAEKVLAEKVLAEKMQAQKQTADRAVMQKAVVDRVAN